MSENLSVEGCFLQLGTGFPAPSFVPSVMHRKQSSVVPCVFLRVRTAPEFLRLHGPVCFWYNNLLHWLVYSVTRGLASILFLDGELLLMLGYSPWRLLGNHWAAGLEESFQTALGGVGREPCSERLVFM